VSSPCYAQEDRPGIAFFNGDATIEQIKSVRQEVDLILLLMHWGLEEYAYPSPSQKQTADSLMDAGVDLIIGHHPHVLQGVRYENHQLVVFSLGNFLFDEFTWSFKGNDGHVHTNLSALSNSNRKSGILTVKCSSNGVKHYDFVPTRIENNGVVVSDDTTNRKNEFKSLCNRLELPGYTLFWKIYSLIMEWTLRISPLFRGEISLKRLTKVRFNHLKQLFRLLRKSFKISSEKTTNPYE
jgi:hypothetical protein